MGKQFVRLVMGGFFTIFISMQPTLTHPTFATFSVFSTVCFKYVCEDDSAYLSPSLSCLYLSSLHLHSSALLAGCTWDFRTLREYLIRISLNYRVA